MVHAPADFFLEENWNKTKPENTMDFRRQRRKNQSAWEEKGALYSQPTPIFSSLLWGQLSPRSNRGNNLGMPVKKKRGGGLHKTLSRKIGGAKQDTKPPTQKWRGEKIIWNVYLRLFTLHKHFLKGTFNSDLCEFKCPLLSRKDQLTSWSFALSPRPTWRVFVPSFRFGFDPTTQWWCLNRHAIRERRKEKSE